MNVMKISFPLIHKKSSLPTFAVLLGIIGAVPILMVMWVAMCSQFTRVEGTNETALYNIYVCVRAIFAIALVAGLGVYDCKRISLPLIPAALLGVISSIMRLIIDITVYSDKKAMAAAIGMNSSYTQNYLNICESALVLILAVMVTVYLFGILKTSFPIVLISVITALLLLYTTISYSTTYEVTEYNVICKIYDIALALGVLLFSLCAKSKAMLEKKQKYQPRRMRK